MTKLSSLFCGALLTSVGLSAASITMSSTCSTGAAPAPGYPGPIVVTGTGGCSVAGPLRYSPSPIASADQTASIGLPTSPTGSVTLYVLQETSASIQLGLSPEFPNAGYLGSASATIGVEDVLTTSGPLRPGYLLFSISGGLGLDPSSAGDNTVTGSEFTLGTYTGACPGINICEIQAGNAFTRSSGVLPFVLGQSFDLTFSESLSSFGDRFDGPTSASGLLDLTFRLVEADGVTPVQISEVPELAGWRLLALTGFVIALRTVAPRFKLR